MDEVEIMRMDKCSPSFDSEVRGRGTVGGQRKR